jgi:hypothetical protein
MGSRKGAVLGVVDHADDPVIGAEPVAEAAADRVDMGEEVANCWKLRTSSPAPASSMVLRATWNTAPGRTDFRCGTGGRERCAARSPAACDLLQPLTELESKVMALAKAVPDEKYSWRPAPGVRSFKEVFLHIAYGNRLMLNVAGGVDLKEIEKHLGQAVEYARMNGIVPPWSK